VVSPPSTSAPRSGALRATDEVTGPAAGPDGAAFAASGLAAVPAWGMSMVPEPPLVGASALQTLRSASLGTRPGTCSSSTAWKLVPPNPNALTPAVRTSPPRTSQSRSSPLTRNGDRLQSRCGFGTEALMLGGSTRSEIAIAVLNRPAAPAAALRWPMLDFTEPSAMDPGVMPSPPKASCSASTSTTSPTRVEVPCPSTSVAVRGSSPALRHARSTPAAARSGWVR
jgi:hypothetical protein